MPGGLKISFQFQYGLDTTCFSHMTFKYSSGPPTPTQIQQVADSAHAGWVTNVKPVHHSSVALTNIVATDLSDPSTPQGLWAGSEVGTATGGVLPASTCVLINMKLARRYRGGHPRMYWPWGTDADLQGPQTWLPASITKFQTAFSGLSNKIASDSTWSSPLLANASISYYHQSTWHGDDQTGHYQVPTPRVPPLLEVATGFSYPVTLGSQRRRIRGRR